VAAIPDVAGAPGAPRGVMTRALLRVVVLGGLVIAGWLLGSGIGQAHEDMAHKNPVMAHKNPVLEDLGPPEVGSGDLLGAPPTVRSTVASVRRAVPVRRLPVQPEQVPILAPVLDPVSQLAAPGSPVTASTARPKAQAAAPKPAVVPPSPVAPAEPVVHAAAVTAPAPAISTMRDAPPDTSVCLAAHPVADSSAEFVGPSAGDSSPATPVPASPSGTTAPCLTGSTAGGATTMSGHSITLSDGWVTTGLNPTQCRLCAGADGITPLAAQRPSTSPD
jgi:hypothetical protein